MFGASPQSKFLHGYADTPMHAYRVEKLTFSSFIVILNLPQRLRPAQCWILAFDDVITRKWKIAFIHMVHYIKAGRYSLEKTQPV